MSTDEETGSTLDDVTSEDVVDVLRPFQQESHGQLPKTNTNLIELSITANINKEIYTPCRLIRFGYQPSLESSRECEIRRKNPRILHVSLRKPAFPFHDLQRLTTELHLKENNEHDSFHALMSQEISLFKNPNLLIQLSFSVFSVPIHSIVHFRTIGCCKLPNWRDYLRSDAFLAHVWLYLSTAPSPNSCSDFLSHSLCWFLSDSPCVERIICNDLLCTKRYNLKLRLIIF